MRRLPTVLLFIAFAFAAAAGLLLWRMGNVPVAATAAASVGGPFALTDQDGRTVHATDFHGRWVLLYFGYTYCPDVCPTTLAVIARTLSDLGAKSADVVPLFVTIDPARDTPAVLKSYLAAFGPRFVGLTGTPAQIAAVAHAYRVYYARHSLPGGSYSMDHSSVIYLLDPNGKFVKAYDSNSGADALAHDLAPLL